MRFTKLSIVAWVIVLLFSKATFAAGTPAMPQYSFLPGRHLEYSVQSDFTYQTGKFETKGTVQLTVLDRNADGSLRILVRSGEKEIQSREGQSLAVGPDTPERVTLSQLNILPSGRLLSLDGEISDDAPFILPPLPEDEKEMAGTWKSQPRLPGETSVFQSPEPAAAGEWVFKSTSEGIFKKIYGIANDRTYHFDLSRGVVTSVGVATRQDYGFKGSGTGTAKLDKDQTIPPEQLTTLNKDAARFFAAQTLLRKKMESIETAPADSNTIEANAQKALSDAQADITTPQFKEQLTQMLATLHQNVDEGQKDGQRFAEIIGKAAFDFSATDLDGKPHKLSDFRGKVVVLDFWYRGCGWCMRAMPQINQLAKDFKDKPVAVIGLNTDSDVNDARFVVDAMQLSYQTLRIEQDVAGKFNVRGFPSMLVIDANGIVRSFDEGYSPTLRVDTEKKIQGLLTAEAGQ